jgi:RHS repeat-associated protein
MTRLIAFLATLLLGAAASAHVPPADIAASLGLDVGLELIALHAEPRIGATTCPPKTAPPARAKLFANPSACANALTHCRLWENRLFEQNLTSGRGVYAYTAFGENDPAGTSGNTSGTTANDYRYTGEQLDPNLGFYYLRARYMDPRQGRFLGMDLAPGVLRIPTSLNKYTYVEGNPVTFVDPTGLFLMTDAFLAQSIGATRNTAPGLAIKPLLKKVAVAAGILAVGTAVMIISQRREPEGIPILIIGKNHGEVRDHIRSAQETIAPSILNRSVENPRGWIYSDPRCSNTGVGTGNDCDEYPFSKTHQGGKKNRERVSLRAVDSIQNQAAGGIYGAMVVACKIPRYDQNPLLSTFKVAVSYTLDSTFYCKPK